MKKMRKWNAVWILAGLTFCACDEPLDDNTPNIERYSEALLCEDGRDFGLPISITTENAYELGVDGAGNDIYVATRQGTDVAIYTSSDGGGTFSSPTIIPNTVTPQGIKVVAVDDGKVVVAWKHFTTTYADRIIKMVTSVDGGASFNAPVDFGPGDIREFDLVASGGDVHLALRKTDELQIYSSTDSGATFGTPETRAVTGGRYEVRLVKDGGYFYLMYMTGSSYVSIYVGVSTDNGATFTYNQVKQLSVSSQSGNTYGYTLKKATMAASGTNVYVAWIEGSTYSSHFYPYIKGVVSNDGAQTFGDQETFANWHNTSTSTYGMDSAADGDRALILWGAKRAYGSWTLYGRLTTDAGATFSSKTIHDGEYYQPHVQMSGSHVMVEGKDTPIFLSSDGATTFVANDPTLCQGGYQQTYTIDGTNTYAVWRTGGSGVYFNRSPVPDPDEDGINTPDDNCPYDDNAQQEDMDGDDVGDVCDPDRDGDGIDNDFDTEPSTPSDAFDDGNGTSGTITHRSEDSLTVADLAGFDIYMEPFQLSMGVQRSAPGNLDPAPGIRTCNGALELVPLYRNTYGIVCLANGLVYVGDENAYGSYYESPRVALIGSAGVEALADLYGHSLSFDPENFCFRNLGCAAGNCPQTTIDLHIGETTAPLQRYQEECFDVTTDVDGDTVPNFFDNCKDDDNPLQEDDDDDGYGNICDNCPVDHNPEQEDRDEDGMGDICDPLPDCNDADLNTCLVDLDTCQEGLDTCQGGLDTCQGGLDTCETALGACTTDLATSEATAQSCLTELNTCQNSLSSCEIQLSDSSSDLAACQSDLISVAIERDVFAANLETCQGDLATQSTLTQSLQAELGTCQEDLAAHQSDIGALQEQLATAENQLAAKQSELDQASAALANAQSELLSCEADLADCLADHVDGDADSDGEMDQTDACPYTPFGEPVDAAGCSLAQFCASVDISKPKRKKKCKFADFMNDEPFPGAAKDCKLVKTKCHVACVPR